MNLADKGRSPFLYILTVTIISILLIILNVLLGMRIPFSISFLAGYVGTALVFVIWHAVLTKGWKRSLLMFALSFVVAFTAEALGVNFGLVFGAYHYTPALGISIFGVPLLAALAWEPIVYAAFCLSDMLAGRSDPPRNWLNRTGLALLSAAIAALATTAWDLMIDPIAVSQGWWVWAHGGAYVPYLSNGVPISNYLGWLLVAFVINLVYRQVAGATHQGETPAASSYYGPLTLYASLFLTAFGVALTVLKRPEVALIGLLAMGPFIIISLTNLPILLLRSRNLGITANK